VSAVVKRSDLLQWLAAVFQEPVEAMDESRTRDSIRTWDSMGSLMLMAELDERVHVTLEEEELKKMTSIGDIFALLRQRQVAIEGE
jgi:acyl carrier protein